MLILLITCIDKETALFIDKETAFSWLVTLTN